MPNKSKKILKGATGVFSVAVGLTMMTSFTPVAYALDNNETSDIQGEESALLMQKDVSSPIMLNELEGTSSPSSYWALLSATRDSNKGIAQNAFEELDGYLDDAQKENLLKAEESVLEQDTFKGMQEEREAFESLLAEPRQQKEADIKAEQEYQEYLAAQEAASYYGGGGDYNYQSGDGVLTRAGGVNEYNGRHETWYSQRVLPGGGLDIPGRHVADDGTIRDGDGYIAVAASDLPQGSVVDTSLGQGKVYDSGCAPGTTDIYTDW